MGSAAVANFSVGYTAVRPTFLDALSSDTAGGILGVGASSLAGLGTNCSWNNWCTTKAYVINLALGQMYLCTSQSGGLQFPFYSGTDRAAFSASITVNVGTNSRVLTPQPMLVDSGSGYIIIDDAVAAQVAADIKAKYPLVLRRDTPGNSSNPEVYSRTMKLTRRQSNPKLGQGPYPSHVNALTTNFYQISCYSYDITLTINGRAFILPMANYVYHDKTGLCYSAIVGVDYSSFVNSAESGFKFGILGMPFLRSPSLSAISVNHGTKIINII